MCPTGSPQKSVFYKYQKGKNVDLSGNLRDNLHLAQSGLIIHGPHFFVAEI